MGANIVKHIYVNSIYNKENPIISDIYDVFRSQ